jgi:hypothetical protein
VSKLDASIFSCKIKSPKTVIAPVRRGLYYFSR